MGDNSQHKERLKVHEADSPGDEDTIHDGPEKGERHGAGWDRQGLQRRRSGDWESHQKGEGEQVQDQHRPLYYREAGDR